MRYILALDIDCFYVQVERSRNPLLAGQPIGIKQKALLATCSYEARAKGVTKLMSIKEAKQICPNLIIINGEDLTHYRLASRAMRRVVREFLGDFEAQGMDEVFVDMTDRVVMMCRGDYKDEMGYRYYSKACPEHLKGQESQELMIAIGLVAELRQRIKDQLGFTTTVGIGPSKMVAKFLASRYKPETQSHWISVGGQEQQNILDFIDNVPARNIPGLGFAYFKRLEETLQFDKDNLTIRELRERVTQGQFQAILGQSLGQLFWSCLHGIDTSLVRSTPLYPNQITVEDSYAGARSLMTLSTALEETAKHALSLLKRLSLELVEDGQWKRHPQTLRLSVRLNWETGTNRSSKSVRFPSDALDLSKSLEERRISLVHLLNPLFMKITNLPVDKTLHIYVINVGVTDLVDQNIDNSIMSYVNKPAAVVSLDSDEDRDVSEIIDLD